MIAAQQGASKAHGERLPLTMLGFKQQDLFTFWNQPETIVLRNRIREYTQV
jgi:hypothetical protein